MRVVTDVSALLGQVLADEDAAYAEGVFAEVAESGALVPPLFWYEIRNALIVGERRSRLSAAQTSFFLAALRDMDFELEYPMPPEAGVLEIARQHGLSVYDAAYLDLSIRTGSPLATLDQKLRDAAKRIGVRLFTKRDA